MMSEIGATCRLQLHAGFGFDAAAAVCGYLKALGITHVYCSPYLQAAPGSTHGYDVVDPGKVNEELGGEAAHARFLGRLKETGLSQVLDIVPNHMAISGRNNRWWWDVLENGSSSAYASFFDVEWQSPEEKLRNKILTPVLGDHYGRVLSAGQIRLVREGGSFVFRYADHEFPAAPQSIAPILAAAAGRIGSDYLAFLADSLARLPEADNIAADKLAERHRDKEVIRDLLTRACAESAETARGIDACIELANRDPDALDQILERQNYRLSFWRTAARDLGYRRFFDINSLVGLRMERQHVFDETHRLVLKWVRDGVVDGLRVDHPDGLRDPDGYFERLHKAAPNAWLVAEKILEPGEELRRSWMVAGTTGYDFLNMVCGLFVDPRGEAPLTRLYQDFTGGVDCWQQTALKSKELVLRDVLGSDLNRLTALFVGICERHRDNRDFTRHDIHQALRDVVCCFPVYRTYARADVGQCSQEDERYIDQALTLARSRRPDLDPGLIEFLRSILLLKTRGNLETEFVSQFQQFTGPAMAKGVEDTAFYNFNRLVALNEVGGDPGRFGVSVVDFHAWCERMTRDWPTTMLATSTHDTKRGEDVRVRIALLSAIPVLWSDSVLKWAARNQPSKIDGLPDRNTEYLLYQTLVGAWPITVDRLQAYMLKAVREARRQTSWTAPNAAFEKALEAFVSAIMADDEFVRGVQSFVEPLVSAGRNASLAQTLIKLTAPGVPDIYQGSELWDLSLVDPDNRRPVDFELRQGLLASLDAMNLEEVMRRADEGLPKLLVIRTALKLRSGLGPYAALSLSGKRSDDVVAYSRGDLVVIAPCRWLDAGAWPDAWDDTSLDLPQDKNWRNAFTGEGIGTGRVLVSDLLRNFPVALLAAA
jgi:(1->4)-alpha-D-glucan 1-alpha-D-glucosylmutase